MRREVSYFNEKSKAYRQEYDKVTPEGYSFRVRREKVLALTPQAKTGATAADIASGPGVMIPGLRAKGYRVTCLDAAPEMIERTKEEYAHLTDVTAIVGDAYDLPLQNDSFDVASAMGLIEYLEDEKKFLSEAQRILKPGGIFLITFPNYTSPWRAFNRLALAIIRIFRKHSGKNNVTHREYTLSRATRILSEAGFKVETSWYYNFKLIPYPFDVKLPRFTVAQSRLFEHLDKTPLKFLGTGFIVRAKKM